MTLLTYEGTTRGSTLNDGVRHRLQKRHKTIRRLTSQRIVNPANARTPTTKGQNMEK